ncbi:hypothetical protein L208DRAFT_1375801 [Tricholoma matsutake]|nr:hypothetical protein L208DRAFT_1375801 [Tricholoma matsutake 945]
MGKPRKSQKASAPPPAPVPAPMATRNGHQQTYTTKQMENKEDTFFSCVTIPHPIKTVIRNGHTLVHRVQAQDSNDEIVRTHVLESQPPHPRGALVHHVPVTYPVPVRMEQDRPPSQVSDKENHELVGTPVPESGPPHQRGAQVAGTPAPGESGPPRPRALVCRVPGTPCPAPVMMEHEHLHGKIQMPQVQSYHDHDISFHPYDQHHEDIDTEDHWMEYEEPSSNFDCSSSPTSLGVRKSPPSRLDGDTTVVTKSAHTGSTRSRGRVHIADFDVLSKGLLEDAIGMYRADITTWNPFPNRLKDHDLAFSKFTKACSERNLSMEFEEDHLKLRCSCRSHHGLLKLVVTSKRLQKHW